VNEQLCAATSWRDVYGKAAKESAR